MSDTELRRSQQEISTVKMGATSGEVQRINGHTTVAIEECVQTRPVKGVDRSAHMKLIIACFLCTSFMVGEIVGGTLAGSLAIVSDAVHLLVDLASFLVALSAVHLAHRPPSDKLNFGWHRIEVLGAFLSILLLWVLTGGLCYTAVLRIKSQNYEIDAKIMLITAATGVFFNVVLATVLNEDLVPQDEEETPSDQETTDSELEKGSSDTEKGRSGFVRFTTNLLNKRSITDSNSNRKTNVDCSSMGEPNERMPLLKECQNGTREINGKTSNGLLYMTGKSADPLPFKELEKDGHKHNREAKCLNGSLDGGRRGENSGNCTVFDISKNKNDCDGGDLQRQPDHRGTLDLLLTETQRKYVSHSKSEADLQRGLKWELKKTHQNGDGDINAPISSRSSSKLSPKANEDETKYYTSSVDFSDTASVTGGRSKSVTLKKKKKQKDKKQSNINLQAAFIHVVGDLCQSVGVLAAAYIIYYKPEWKIADPICTFSFSFIVMITTLTVMRDIVIVLMEATPRDFDVPGLRSDLLGVSCVTSVHNVRVWSITLDKTAISAHLCVDEETACCQVLKTASGIVMDKYHAHEASLQIEVAQEMTTGL